MLTSSQTRKLTGLNKDARRIHRAIPIHRSHAALLNSFELIINISAFFTDDRNDGKVILLGKIKVALIAGWYTHDSTGTVIKKHVIRHPNRNGFAGDGIECIAPREYAVLLAVGSLPLNGSNFCGSFLQIGKGSLIFRADNKFCRK